MGVQGIALGKDGVAWRSIRFGYDKTWGIHQFSKYHFIKNYYKLG